MPDLSNISVHQANRGSKILLRYGFMPTVLSRHASKSIGKIKPTFGVMCERPAIGDHTFEYDIQKINHAGVV